MRDRSDAIGISTRKRHASRHGATIAGYAEWLIATQSQMFSIVFPWRLSISPSSLWRRRVERSAVDLDLVKLRFSQPIDSALADAGVGGYPSIAVL
jgi:hypothetical protein